MTVSEQLQLEYEYLKLQNGSDVRGIALEGVEGEHINMTPEKVSYIAAAFAAYVSQACKKKLKDCCFAVGHDSRLSTDLLMEAAMKGIREMGAEVLDCGLASTPSMFMATVMDGMSVDGAIMITASHLPFNRNGMKLFTDQGGFEKAQISEVLGLAGRMKSVETLSLNKDIKVQKFDLMAQYSAHLRDVIKKEVNAANYEKPLEGLHIVVDASNGSGGFFPGQVLTPLGADVSGSIFLEPDGTFPNHVPNPENKEAMDAIKDATLQNHGDLGIIFDTDVDRAAAVFSNGKEINRNDIIALIGAIVAKKYPGSTIVTDSVTSDELTDFLENTLQLKHHRFKRGYKNVINEAIRLNKEGIESQLAIETSGHGALKENYFLDDGAYLSVKMICETAIEKRNGKKIEDLLSGLKEPAETTEYRIKIQAEDFKGYGEMVLQEFMEFCSWQEDFHLVPNNYEGVRVSFDDTEVKGWLLLRMSLHDPLLPLNIEAKEIGGVEIIKKRVQGFFEQFDRLDSNVF